MAYATTQAIREAAGLQSRVDNETPIGLVNGTNRSFAVKRKPIVDADYNEHVNEDDITVLVNGAEAEIEILDAAAGTFTLLLAPAAGTNVRVSYQQSSLTQYYVDGKIEEADSWVNMKLRSYGIENVPLSPVPAIISTAAELYAAGMILYKDWGNRANTDYSAKDGELKITQARKLIEEYCISEKNQRVDNSSASQAVATTSDPNVFSRRIEPDIRKPHEVDDDFWWNRQ